MKLFHFQSHKNTRFVYQESPETREDILSTEISTESDKSDSSKTKIEKNYTDLETKLQQESREKTFLKEKIKFEKLWEEREKYRAQMRNNRSSIDWEKMKITYNDFLKQAAIIFDIVSQDEAFQKSESYQGFIKSYPSFNQNDIHSIDGEPFGGRENAFGPQKTIISRKDYSIVFVTRKNITSQSDGKLYDIPEIRTYQIKLNINNQDIFLGAWDYLPYGQRRK